VNLSPPRAQKKRTQRSFHNKMLTDDYSWLAEINAPEVHKYLAAESEYCSLKMTPTNKLQHQLYKEIVQRIDENDTSVPYLWKEYFYYERTYKNKEYAVYLRQHTNTLKEETLLDLNKLREGQPYLDLGDIDISPDQRWLAYTLDYSGDEIYDLYIKDLLKETAPLLITKTMSGDICWHGDSHSLFYTSLDSQLRPNKVHLHDIFNTESTSSAADEVIFEEQDEHFYVSLCRSSSDQYTFIACESKDTTEINYIQNTNGNFTSTPIYPRIRGVEYNVDELNNHFYICINDTCCNFRLYKTPVTNTSDITELVQANTNEGVVDFEVMNAGIAVIERKNGLLSLVLLNEEEAIKHAIRLTNEPCTLSLVDNYDCNNSHLRVEIETNIHPPKIYDIDWNTRDRTLLKEQKVHGNYQPEDYATLKLHATSKDGTKVPISLIAKKSILDDSAPAPILLHAYGAYGEPLDPWFSHSRISLLDRGVIFAIAHVRGGGDLGMAWYQDGKLKNKPNTILDFIACSEYLLDNNFTTSKMLAINGGSAGGLLIGAALNKQPHLYQCAILDAPFLDCLNTMLDESLPLTITEFDEWGNPKKEEYFDLIQSYSPYENICTTDYPHILVLANINDTRVQHWEAAKWVAKLRTHKTDNNDLLLHLDDNSGHAGASGRYSTIKEIAFQYAFLFENLNITKDN